MGLHDGRKVADQSVDSVYMVATGGIIRPPPGIECKPPRALAIMLKSFMWRSSRRIRLTYND